MFWSKDASFSLKSAAPFRGDPLCCGEFSADFLLLSTSLAIATRRSKPIDISSCHLLVSSGAEPSPEEEVAGFLDNGGDTSGLAGLLRESSPVMSGVCREDLEPVLVGRELGISGELNRPARPSFLVDAFSFSK